MTKKHIKIIGFALLTIGLVFSVIFHQSVHFNLDPQVWFTPEYYLQFIPLYIAATLFLCGLFVVIELRSINFYLAVFGHSASEEILFSLAGLTTTPLPNYAAWIFLPLSCIALWMAYTNTLNCKKVSRAEAIFGVLFSTAFILWPRFW